MSEKTFDEEIAENRDYWFQQWQKANVALTTAEGLLVRTVPALKGKHDLELLDDICKHLNGGRNP